MKIVIATIGILLAAAGTASAAHPPPPHHHHIINPGPPAPYQGTTPSQSQSTGLGSGGQSNGLH